MSHSIAPISKPVMNLVRQAVIDFGLIAPGDRVAVGLSGGKDSLLMACALRELAQHEDMSFEIGFVHLDQNQPGFNRLGFQDALDKLNIDCAIIDKDTHSVVQSMLKPGQIPCAICGRMRRGILNNYCAEHSYNKLAMGHHLDDAIETFFLNLLYGRRLEPLKAATEASELPVTTIRPLILVEERKIQGWIDMFDIPVVACPACDTFPESRRRDIKGIINELASLQTDVHASVRTALYAPK